MKLLVTGGAGYIGSHTCKLLAEAGHVPITYDNLIYGHDWAVRWGPLEQGDIADRTRLDEVMSRYKPDAVLHFAAFAYVGESVTHPARYYRNNVAGTLTLLEAMRDHGIGSIVFSSTCATYGNVDVSPIPETCPQRPINPYGKSKWMVEQILRDFDEAYGIRSISLRYFNAAGADPSGLIGEDHNPETHLIPLILDVAQGRRPCITVFGDDYDTPDGTCVRDYIHVNDLALAHLLALEGLLRGKGTNAYNLGNAMGFSVKEVIETAAQVTGRPITTEIGPRRPGDPPHLVGEAHRATIELGWIPRYPSLAAMIETAWKWHCHLHQQAKRAA